MSVPFVLAMDYEVRKSIYRFLFGGRRRRNLLEVSP